MARKHPKKDDIKPDFPLFEDEVQYESMYGVTGSREDAALTLEDLSAENKNYKYRICLLGTEATGKSAFLKLLSDRGFHTTDHYRPTRREFRNRINDFVITPDTKVDILIHDFGPECQEYRTVMARAIERAQGYIIFFADDYPPSFDAVEGFATKIAEHKDISQQSIAVVGLRNGDRKVAPSDAQAWAQNWSVDHGCTMDFFSYKADKQGFGVEAIMRYVISGIMIKEGILIGSPYNPMEKPKQPKSKLHGTLQRVKKAFK